MRRKLNIGFSIIIILQMIIFGFIVHRNYQIRNVSQEIKNNILLPIHHFRIMKDTFNHGDVYIDAPGQS